MKKLLHKLIKKPIAIIRENKRAYISVNAVFYGLFLLSMLITWFFPELQEKALASIDRDFAASRLASSVEYAYINGNILAAICLTLFVNLTIGIFISMTLPSLAIPFVGLFMGLYRALFWGAAFSPLLPDAALIPHALTLIIEGQAYILAMLAIFLQGRAFLTPGSIALKSRRDGYKHGLIQTAWIYIPIIIILLFGAVYEAFEVILIIPLFQ